LHNLSESNDFILTQQQHQALISLIQKSGVNNNVDLTPIQINQFGSLSTSIGQNSNMNDNHDDKICSVNNFSKNKEYWIIDSGAANYVSCSLKIFCLIILLCLSLLSSLMENMLMQLIKELLKFLENYFCKMLYIYLILAIT